jgi:hypothetical protein
VEGRDVSIELPAATVEQWRDLALAALCKSGAAPDTAGPEQVDELHAAETYDGLRIAALHTQADRTTTFRRSARTGGFSTRCVAPFRPEAVVSASSG